MSISSLEERKVRNTETGHVLYEYHITQPKVPLEPKKFQTPLGQGEANPQNKLINKVSESQSRGIKLTHQMSLIPLSAFWSWLLLWCAISVEHTAGVLSRYEHRFCLGPR